MKWKLRKAYKLELNDEEKTTLEINSVRKESKDMLWQQLAVSNNMEKIFLLLSTLLQQRFYSPMGVQR